MTEISVASAGGSTRAGASILAMVDPTQGDAVTPLLEEHLALSGRRFKCVRNHTAWDASPQLRSQPVLPPAFSEGARCLEALGLTLDVGACHPQM